MYDVDPDVLSAENLRHISSQTLATAKVEADFALYSYHRNFDVEEPPPRTSECPPFVCTGTYCPCCGKHR